MNLSPFRAKAAVTPPETQGLFVIVGSDFTFLWVLKANKGLGFRVLKDNKE